MSFIILSLMITVVTWVVWQLTHNFFIRLPLDNVPGPQSPSYVKGNLVQLFDRHHNSEFLDHIGTKYNKVVRLAGLFGHRMLYVFDPKSLQYIMQKDLGAIDIPEWQLDVNRMTIGHGLSGAQGARHRHQRKMLNPAFSTNHLVSLTPLFYSLAHRLCSGIETEVGNGPTTVDILGWLGRAGLEYIGQGGLGYSLDTLDKPVPNPFGDALKQYFPLVFHMSEWQFLLKHFKKLGSASFRSALVDWIPMPKLHELKRLVMTMEHESKVIIADKRNTLQKGAVDFGEATDIMDILIRANNAASEEDRLEEDELVGQMSLLVLAGTDSTSNALSQVAQILAHRPDIQDKLRAEIVEAQDQYGEDIPHDTLLALPYMDAICRESLRLCPPLSFSFREAIEDVVLPLADPIIGVDGVPMKEIPVPAGTTIILGVKGVNVSKDIWGDDAMEFKPERWLNPLPSSVTDARIPGVYPNQMTFLGGGRSCIGYKFSQLEMKVILSVFLPKFKITLAEKTKDVVWNISTVRYPTVGRESGRPELPIKLERIRD